MSEQNFEMLGVGVGSMLADRYEIEEVLGRGGMGSVFGVRDKALGRERFALKLLDPRLCVDAVDVERFRQEVLISRRLTHPNIVRTFEFGQLPRGQNFVVMEYVQGKTLEQLLGQSPGGIPFAELVSILIEIARGMSYAHDHGVVHRDLKPGNILIGPDGSVKITDFGLARSNELQTKLTRSGVCVGTPMYMAPEQVTGQIADHRVDIYGLGVIAYELCTGATPYSANAWYTLANEIVSQPMPKLSRLRPRVPSWLESFVERATAKNADERFQTMEEICDFLIARQPEEEPETARMRVSEYLRDSLHQIAVRQGTVFVMAGIAFIALLASVGMARGPATQVEEKVNSGTTAIGRVLDTLNKLNRVVTTTYKNSDKIDRFLDEEERKQQNASSYPGGPPELPMSMLQPKPQEQQASPQEETLKLAPEKQVSEETATLERNSPPETPPIP